MKLLAALPFLASSALALKDEKPAQCNNKKAELGTCKFIQACNFSGKSAHLAGKCEQSCYEATNDETWYTSQPEVDWMRVERALERKSNKSFKYGCNIFVHTMDGELSLCPSRDWNEEDCVSLELRDDFNNDQTEDSNRINRPKNKDDSIAVIGGGLGGIYSAYQLKKLGYTDITVYEKSDNVGGKMQSYKQAGHWMGVGTVIFADQYEWMMKLAQELDEPLYDAWVPAIQLYNYLPMPEGLVDKEKYPTNFDWMMAHQDELHAQVDRYEMLYNQIFEKSNDNYHFGDKISMENMQMLGNQTFLEWSNANDLQLLFPFFEFGFTNYFYESATRLDPFYGMYWCPPSRIRNFVNGEGQNFRFKPALGFEGLVERMVIAANIKVIYNADVQKVKRGNKIAITYKTPAFLKSKTVIYDFLISAIHPYYYQTERKSRQVFKMNEIEQELLGYDNWDTNNIIIDMITPNEDNIDFMNPYKGANPGGLYFYYPEDLAPMGLFPKWTTVVGYKRKYNMFSRTPRYWKSKVEHDDQNPRDMSVYYNNAYNFGNKMTESFQFYFIKWGGKLKSTGVMRHPKFNPEHIPDLERMTANDLKIKAEDVFNAYEREYFNRWTHDNLKLGKPQRLMDYNVNNNQNTWFVGGYASFEATNWVADYIELLLERTEVKERMEEHNFNMEDLLVQGEI